MAAESVGRQVPMALLERIKDDFNKKYSGGKTATANTLNKEFGYKGSYCSQEVAIKVLQPERMDSYMLGEFSQEVFILRKIRHKNVVQFIGACTKVYTDADLNAVGGGKEVYTDADLNAVREKWSSYAA